MASVSGGKLALPSEAQFALRSWTRGLGDGEMLMLTIGEPKKVRSLKANAYYWGVVIKAAVDYTGHSADDIHAYWCSEFLPDEHKRLEFYNKLTGSKIRATVDVRRSSKLSHNVFCDFVEQCREWLARELGVNTPDPDKAYWKTRAKKTEAA